MQCYAPKVKFPEAAENEPWAPQVGKWKRDL